MNFLSLLGNLKPISRIILSMLCIPLLIVGFMLPHLISTKAIQPDTVSVSGDLAPYDSENGIFLPAIMYHSVSDDPSRWGEFVISSKTLASDLSYLKNQGYNTVFIRELADYVYNGVSLPENPVLITFDDGYYNNLTTVVPVLKEYKSKAVISVVGEFCDRFQKLSEEGNKDAKNPAYAHLDWLDLKTLLDSGYVELGNHTYNMHSTANRKGCGKLPNESESAYVQAIAQDIGALQEAFENNLGIRPLTFTYPFGAISRESIPVIKDLGFLATLTCYEHPNYITRHPDTLIGISRYNRPSGPSTEEFMKKALRK